MVSTRLRNCSVVTFSAGFPDTTRSHHSLSTRCFRQIRAEHGSFCDWLWKHSGGKTILYIGHESKGIPASNGLSDEIAKELKKYGFKYMGSVTVYAHLQACGIVNDHAKDCPCYRRIHDANPTVRKRRDREN